MIKFILGGVVGVLAIVFMMQNHEVVEISFLFWTLTTSRALILFVMLGIGMVLGASGTMLLRRRRRR